MSLAETIAAAFHTTYEQLAPEYGYRTRSDSAVAWGDVPTINKQLMIATAQHLIDTGVITAVSAAAAIRILDQGEGNSRA